LKQFAVTNALAYCVATSMTKAKVNNFIKAGDEEIERTEIKINKHIRKKFEV
jgi:hypothetical protein